LNEFSFRLHLMKILINFSIQMEKNTCIFCELNCLWMHIYIENSFVVIMRDTNLAFYYTIIYTFILPKYFISVLWSNAIACFHDDVSNTAKTHDLYTLLHRSLHLQVPVKYDNCVAVNFYNILNVFHYKTLKCYV
jgi:hypothetical protein